MPVTVKVNGTANSLVHKGSNGVSMATIPDVCKTPSPAGPVPIPYPNISQSTALDKGSSTVKADGMMIAIKGSEFSMSNGDNAGTAGGVKSSTFMKESTWILYSFDVKIDGQNACRLTDKKFQNHENTADMGGLVQPGVAVSGSDDDECVVGAYDDIKNKCPEGSQAHHIVPDYTARMGTRIEGIAGTNRIPGMPSFGNGPSICLKGHARTTGSEHNMAHQCDQQIAALGARTNNGPVGTAPVSQVVPVATEAAIQAKPQCEKQIREEVEKRYGNANPNQSMRTTQQPATGAARSHLGASGSAPVSGVTF
ncbi:MAG: DUF4150 domain-containing protein [Acidobacteriota bacterium]